MEKVSAMNLNAVFFVECQAQYPIEWIFHYSQGQVNNGTKPTVTRSETRRKVVHFEDQRTYSYTASVTLMYIGKATDLSHFTCVSTIIKTSKLETHVLVEEAKNSTVLQLQVSKVQLAIHKAELYNTFRHTCPVSVWYNAQVEERRICWTCNTHDTVVQILTCTTPIQCNSLFESTAKTSNCLYDVGWHTCNNVYSHFNGPDRCGKFVGTDKQIAGRYSLEGCPYTEDKDVFNTVPKVGQCVNLNNKFDVEVVASGLLYFGIPRSVPEEDRESENGKMRREEQATYSKVDGAKISEMIYLYPLKAFISPGESVEIKCEYSRLHFSLGTWFGVKHSAGVIQHFLADDVRPCDTDAERQQMLLGTVRNGFKCDPNEVAGRRGTFTASTTKTFEASGRYDIFCFGPIWNIVSWANTSRSFEVVKWEEPKVLSLIPDGNKKFLIGEKNRSLKCEFEGNPVPTVRWTTPGNDQLSSVTRCLTSTLIIDEVKASSRGNYTCHAESLNSSHFQQFIINPEILPKPQPLFSPTVITAMIIVSLIVFVGLIAAFARMRETIVEQRKALRLLSDEEVKEFKEGTTYRSEYIDNIAAIDALPYDEKFEIPLDRLSINYAAILGSGEYGLILKAKLLPQKTLNYANLAMQFRAVGSAVMMVTNDGQAEAPPQELDVAVKVCKKRLGVEAFKALLSEVKVMAYLGRHDNIVSLIGATTGNIRNREIYIAEELCQNGSLENFVRKNKKLFFSKVKRGRYLADLEPSTPEVTPSSTENITDPDSGNVFSTTELIRWARDIATGVEYIHEKRVVHGDLALRNVLITGDFVAKIGDFGLSRRLGEMSIYAKTTQCPLPWRSMAIESMQQLQFSVKSDMWSLGLTLWEMFTLGNLPYQGRNYTQDFIAEIDNGSLRLQKPHYAPNQIYDFMAMCWENVPEDRPSTVDLRAICRGLLQESPSE